MATIANLMVKINGNISGLNKSLKDAQGRLKSASKSMNAVGRTATLGMTLPIVGFGAAVVKSAADFEQSMANAASVSGATGEELEKMTTLARDMGKTTVFSAQDSADAMYYMASAGYKAQQMAESLEPTLDLAAATQADLAFTTDTVIASLNQFGLEAQDTSRVTNTFAAVIGNSQATLDKLGYSMRYVGPVANSLGYSIESTTAALGLLYNAGFKGEQAGTVLRGALSQLLNPSKAADRALSQLGLNYAQVNPATNSLAEIIDVLGDSSLNTSQAIELFGQEAGPGMMALIAQGSDALLDMENKITDTSAASEMAAKQLDTFKGQLKLLKSEVTEVAIQLGNILIPMLAMLVSDYISPLVNWFSNLDTAIQENILIFAGLAAAIGPILMILGAMASGLSVLASVLSFLATPIGLVVAAIVGLIAYFAYLFKTNEEFRSGVMAVWEEIKTFLIATWELIKTTGISIWESLQAFWDSHGETIMAGLLSVWESISSILVSYWNFIKTIALSIFGGLLSFWENHGDSIMTVFNLIWGTISTLFTHIATFLVAKLQEISAWWNQIWPDLAKAFENIWKGIWFVLEPIIKLIVKLFMRAWPFVESLIMQVWGNIKGVISGALDIIMGLISAFAHLFTGNWSALWEDIKQIISGALKLIWNGLQLMLIGKIFKFVGTFGAKMIGKFVNMWKKIKYEFDFKLLEISGAVTSRFKAIIDFVKGLGSSFFNAGKGLINQMKNGIDNAAKRVLDSVKKIAQKVRDFLPFSPAKTGPLSDLHRLDFAGPVQDSIMKGIPKVQTAMTHMLDTPDQPAIPIQNQSRGGDSNRPIIIYLGNEKVYEGFDNHLGDRFNGLGGAG